MFRFGLVEARVRQQHVWLLRFADGYIMFWDGRHGVRRGLWQLPHGYGRAGAARS
jgi:hypothetical protein